MRRAKHMLAYGLLTLSVAGVAGCGSGGGHASASASAAKPPTASHRPKAVAGAQKVTIVGNTNLRFVPSVVHLHVGTVVVHLEDSGAYPHNIVVPALGFTSNSVTGTPGQTTTTFTLHFKHAGRFPFYCQYHQSAGMTGTFIVS